jgi:uncharacterized protein YukJ
VPLPGYGLLVGRITASRAQRKGTPHWLLLIQPADQRHPAYRAAVNMQSTLRGHAAEIDYQIVDFNSRALPAGNALVESLRARGPTSAFMPKASNPSVPGLDFVRGQIINPTKFAPLPAGSNPLKNEFADTLAEVAAASKNAKALVAVFGTGYPIDPKTGASVPTGFTGIENVHMNQGAMNVINGAPYYLENGPNQDGGLIFLLPSGAKGFFVKFRTQTINTDEAGNPTVTGIDKLDKTSKAIRTAIMPRVRAAARTVAASAVATRGATAGTTAAGVPAAKPPGKAPQPSATTNPYGYFFADFDPNDASGAYIPDDDANTYKTPYVMTRSTGQTRGPVPAPREYPRLALSSVVGNNPPGYVKNSSGEAITFNIIGDSGAPSQHSLDSYELKVTDLLARDAQSAPPAFLFHVGDVVYFYGEQDYYYSQFYEPLRAYPAPVFAIPGNHDGITYNDSMISLDAFQKAFCATAPARWSGSAGILRSTMTQPGVYFTLDAPLVSIIGLYSNCGESYGWLDSQQLIFLYQELVRLKAARANGLPAVILAIHHFPRWFPGQKPADPTSTAIDAACKKAGFWPDAIICGHAHLYQRVVRQDTGQDIPYVLSGAGGYGISPQEQVGKAYMAKIASSGTQLSRVINESGYVRAIVTNPSKGDCTLRFEYHSVNQTSNEPDDVCTLNLRTAKVM